LRPTGLSLQSSVGDITNEVNSNNSCLGLVTLQALFSNFTCMHSIARSAWLDLVGRKYMTRDMAQHHYKVSAMEEHEGSHSQA